MDTRWTDRITTWSVGVIAAGVAGTAGSHPVVAASIGVAGALAAAAVLSYGGRAAAWYRDHAATVGVGALCALYLAFGLVLVWIRWGS